MRKPIRLSMSEFTRSHQTNPIENKSRSPSGNPSRIEWESPLRSPRGNPWGILSRSQSKRAWGSPSNIVPSKKKSTRKPTRKTHQEVNPSIHKKSIRNYMRTSIKKYKKDHKEVTTMSVKKSIRTCINTSKMESINRKTTHRQSNLKKSSRSP